ncbi:FKBP-type peptidyl-prolyl cis-trans isomerase [Corallincola spongiicola]|uniref:Peptidyl-prolyl cis-trans isomerase n=1 Tax=Corallincola spongiicola TaxID=2520508 RepID=A0ABY1WLT3_9GAMM|nr:FKBP-type peptidyl-prolyl cis-trans isomerase [Corallincola spongiicola]TAA41865.1 FKBP-type peptidyl-prolyl cis-trans isomerase [Corallincola spongiicola]
MSKAVIDPHSEVVMHFTLKLADGSVAETTKLNQQPAKLVMGDGSLTPAFEQCLLGMCAGEQKAFELKPEDAFGLSNPDLIHHVERSKFPADLAPEEGAIMTFSQPNGAELPGIIRAVAGESITVDFNHPLAGQTITFDVEVITVAQPEAKS